MGFQPVSARFVRRVQRSTGMADIVRVVGNGSYTFEFVTSDHRHGLWHKTTGIVAWPRESDVVHWSSCDVLFVDGFLRECWCGGPIATRDYGDRFGIGCLNFVHHDYRSPGAVYPSEHFTSKGPKK